MIGQMNARSSRPRHLRITLHHLDEGLEWRANHALHSLPIQGRELSLDIRVIDQMNLHPSPMWGARMAASRMRA
jgi:hypothetical protein